MVVCNDEKLAAKIRLMREKAKTSKKAQQEFKRKKIKKNLPENFRHSPVIWKHSNRNHA